MSDTIGATDTAHGVMAVREPAADRPVAEGTVAKNHAGHGNPDALVAEIEHTREDLARTIDELADRVSPASNLRIIREMARERGNLALEQARKPEVQLGAAAAGVALAGLIVLGAWARHRRKS